MLRLLSVIAICAGLFCLAQSNAQVPLTGAGPSGAIAVSCSFSTISFTGGSLGAASLSRSSSGTYINVSGVLTTAASNAARFNYDANYPRGGTPSLTGPFLLVEPAATNLVLQSNSLTTTWSAINGAVVANSIASPDGTNDAWSITGGTGTGAVFQTVTLSNVAYTLSAWQQLHTGAQTVNLWIGSAGPNVTTTLTWTRSTYSTTPSAGATNIIMSVFAVTPAIANFFAAQLETGSVATSYIATTTGTANRSADVVTFTQPAGCGHNTYTFDNNSTQVVSQAPGTATVPTNLNRPNIKSIAGST